MARTFEDYKGSVAEIENQVDCLNAASSIEEIADVQTRLDNLYHDLSQSIELEEDDGICDLLFDLKERLEEADADLALITPDDEDEDEDEDEPVGDPDAQDKDGPDA
jgi:hypothetical protein